MPEHEEWIYETAIPKLEKDWGVETVIVQAGKTYSDYFNKKRTRGKSKGKIYGFPALLIGNWCNNRLKTNPMDSYKREQKNYREIIGIATDEPNRMKSKRNSPDVVLPLVEHGITQAQSFMITEKRGYCLLLITMAEHV